MIQLDKKDFLSMPYAVKADRGSGHKAEVDTGQRTVDLIANTYYYFDTYGDVLLSGCCAKSIQDRGPQSKSPGKIKHLSNHDLRDGVGRPDLLEETTLSGMEVLHANSWMSETTNGEQTLIKYNEGLIDQHSIGFNYMTLTYLEPESDMWDEIIKKVINPDEAIAAGFMWAVAEIKLFEYSSLDGFGANRLTPFLGVKSDNVNVQYNNLVSKLDALHTAMRSGGDKELMNLQERQIKQMIYELYNPEPDLKDTERQKTPPPKKSTFDVGSAITNMNLKL
ncbi:MAG: hypothetical protein KJN62_04620 [Deltaproteobacteria bacterium]|nr:hypothetical protein [Deltaproteobacteria bacterium]